MKEFHKIFRSIKYYLLVFSIQVWDLIKFSNIENDGFAIHSFTTTPYVLSYQDFGLIPRGLIGSIIKVFKPFVSVRFLGFLIFLTNLALILLVTAVLGKVIYDSKKNQSGIMSLAIIYLLSPASISFLFSKGEFGRFDLFLIFISVICVIMSSHKIFKWLIPILCMSAVAIHEVFIFTYFVLVFVTLLYMIYENNRCKTSITLTILTFILTSFTFIYFQFFAIVNRDFQSSTDMKVYLQKYTNLIPNDGMLGFEYFSDINSHFFEVSLSTLSVNITNLVISLLLLYPILYIFVKTWIIVFRNTNDRALKYILVLMTLSPLVALPAFVFTIDWGRWLASILIVQFAYIFFLEYKGKLHNLPEILKIANAPKNNLVYLILLTAYLPTLGKFRGSNNGSLALPHTIANFLRTLFFYFIDGVSTIYQNFFL